MKYFGLVFFSSLFLLAANRGLFSLISYEFCGDYRDCDQEAFGTAATQNWRGPTGVCWVSSLAKEEIHWLLYVISYANFAIRPHV